MNPISISIEVKFIETENRVGVTRGWHKRDIWSYRLVSTDFQFGKVKKITHFLRKDINSLTWSNFCFF